MSQALMKAFESRIIRVIPRARFVKSFQCSAGTAADYQAGQFMQVILEIKGAEQAKYLSFSSSPTEKGYIEFTKKMTGSDFSNALESLKAGDRLMIKMPMGKFVLDETASKHAFLSGGIGITPIRSMLRYVLDRCLSFDMALFYSNRSPEDIVFKTELEAMEKDHKNLKTVFSLDTPEACPPGWKGKCGFINAGMIREELPDYRERVFYVCGPPVMVTGLVSILEGELKVPSGRIKRENFSGY